MYAIVGATGHIGSHIADSLLDNGKKVRVIGRSADRLNRFVEKGAEAAVGNVEDTAFLNNAFKDVDAVFSMIPPKFDPEDFRAYQNEIGQSEADAIKDAGVKYIVNLSSIGGNFSEGTGVVLGLHDQEERLNAFTDVNVVHLRPAYFMENLFMSMDLIRKMNIVGTAIDGDIAFPMVATPDVAAVAAEYFLNLDFKGHSVRDILGPRDVSYNEVTKVLGEALGKPDLKYVRISDDEMKTAMIQMGASPSAAEGTVGLAQAINNGLLRSATQRTPESTTATDIKDFAKIFAEIYRSPEKGNG